MAEINIKAGLIPTGRQQSRYNKGMSSYVAQAVELLKSKGFRVTQPRRFVLELLEQSPQALSAYEIKDRIVEAGNTIDTVSVYRILECLEENDLIHRILSTGKVKKCQLEHEDHCTRHQEDHCHHLLICTGCGDVSEIHCPGIHDVIKTVEKNSKFKIHHHSLEFSGLCKHCA